jgi:hypothetical protein
VAGWIVFILGTSRIARVGFRQLLAVAAYLALPWCIFLALSGEPSPRAPAILDWIVMLPGLLLLGLAAVLGWLVWELSRQGTAFLVRRDLSPRKKAWLVCVLAISGAFAVPWMAEVSNLLESYGGRLRTAPHFQAWLHSRFGGEFAPFGLITAYLDNDRKHEQHPWLRAMLEWHSSWGLLAGSIVAVVLVLLWTGTSQWSRTSAATGRTLRSSIAGVLRSSMATTTRSLFLGGCTALVIYLAVAPAAIEEAQHHYSIRRARLLNPDLVWQELHSEAAALRAEAKSAGEEP